MNKANFARKSMGMRPRALYRYLVAAALAGVLLGASAMPAAAATYWVSPTGSNANSGTSSVAPWGTMQYAVAELQPGDTLNVMNGAFAPQGTQSNPAYITPANSGTQSAPITIQNAPGATPVLGDPISLSANQNYITLSGLTLTNISGANSLTLTDCQWDTVKSISVSNITTWDAPWGGDYGGAGIILMGCNECQVSHCSTYNTQQTGIGVYGSAWGGANPGTNPAQFPSQYCVVDSCTVDSACNGGYDEALDMADGVANCVVSNCTVTDSILPPDGDYSHGGEGIDVKDAAYNIWVCDNKVNQVYRNGIYIDGGYWMEWVNGTQTTEQSYGDSNIYVIGNTAANDQAQNGISITSEVNGPLNNIWCADNVCYSNSGDGILLYNYGAYVDAPHANIDIVDNTSFGNASGIDTDSDAGSNPNLSNVNLNNNIVLANAGYSLEYAASVWNSWPLSMEERVSENYNIQDDWAWWELGVHGANDAFFNTSAWTASSIFVDQTGGNYALAQYLSDGTTVNPAIGAGAASGIGATGLDIAGNLRPTPGGADSGYDLGAYQYAGQAPAALPTGTFSLVSRASGFYLNDPASGGMGTQLDQASGQGQPAEQWTILPVRTNCYALECAANGLCAGVNGAASAGGDVVLEPYTGHGDQLWYASSATDSSGTYYIFFNQLSGQALQVSQNSTQAGAGIVQGASTNRSAEWSVLAPAPAAPTGLAASSGNSQVKLSWTASAGATSYKVYRGTSSGREDANAIGSSTTTSYTESGLTNGTTYYYKVAAVGPGGTSGMSNEAWATPEAAVLHTFAAGLQMISAPTDDSGDSLAQIFSQSGTTLAVWNSGEYVLSPTAPADTIRPGQGYWVRFTGSASLYDVGQDTNSSQAYTVALAAGWNMIGDPFASGAAGASVEITSGSQTYSLVQANKAGLIAATLYTYQPGDTAYESQPVSSAAFAPFEGYWIDAFSPCTLVFAGGT